MQGDRVLLEKGRVFKVLMDRQPSWERSHGGRKTRHVRRAAEWRHALRVDTQRSRHARKKN